MVDGKGGPTLAGPPKIAGVIRSLSPARYSMTLGTFVDPDFVQLPPGTQSNTSMFYWLEYPSQAASQDMSDVYARCCVIDGDTFVSDPQTLSVKAGLPRSWESKKVIGDYMSGGFFYHDHALNFVPQWLEAGEIRANIVKVQL